MAINHPKAGPNSIPAYQMSGIPYLTASVNSEVSNTVTAKIEFPYVTRFFQVECTDATNGIRVGFSDAGVDGVNYFEVGTNSKSEVYEFRTKDLFIRGDGGVSDFRVIAGLTTISRDQFPTLTGSVNGNEGFDGIG
jgi:hypothetical protein